MDDAVSNMNAKKNLKHVQVIAFLIIGNVLEWYGFTVCVNILIQIMPVFIPSGNHALEVTFEVILFAAAFILRPVGGLLFGHYGDRLGRVNVLWLSMVLMFIPTFLIGLVPSYQVLGYGSMIILFILRILQGLSVGGEFPASITYVVEIAPPKLRGLYGSIPFVGAFLGMLLAELIRLGLSALFSNAQVIAWAWRLPFLFSLILALIGLSLSFKIKESHQFSNLRKKRSVEKLPLTAAFRKQGFMMFKMFLLTGIAACTIYLLIVYLATYFASIKHVSSYSELKVTIYSLISLVVFTPIFAWFSDRLGRRPVMLCGCLGIIIEVYPLFVLFGNSGLPQMIFAEVLIGMLGACVVGPLSAMLAENFKTDIRNTAIGVSYNFAFLIFAGLAPLIAESLRVLFAVPEAPSLYVIIVAVLAIIVTLLLKETQAHPLSE